MSFREELGKIRREYRQELSQMAKRQAELDAKVDAGLERMEIRLVAIQDQMSAVVADNRQLRADLQESSRTAAGRMRLSEEKLNKMLDMVEQEMEKVDPSVISDIQSRLEALEKRDNPAA